MPQFKSLSPRFGTEASGVDLSQPLSDAVFSDLERALYEHQILVIRGQNLTPQQFASFARRFGPPEPHVIDKFHHPEDPNILVLSNIKKDGQPIGLQDAGSYFHTDYSYLAVPARATTLYSVVVPEEGGNTLFANQYAAYDDLPESTKKRLKPLKAIHHYGNRHDLDENSRTVASVLTPEQKAKMPLITHPIVRPHPVTGRLALYSVTGSSFGIVGMPDDEALALLDELARHATQEKYLYSLRYGLGDLVVWDNASLVHSSTLLKPEHGRLMWRITIKEPPSGAKAEVLSTSFAATT